MDRINGLDVKICDFGLAQRIVPGMTHFVEFGHPEFVSPEIVDKNSVTFSTDSWSGEWLSAWLSFWTSHNLVYSITVAGIIAYILLTGISPFLAENDRATLQNIKNKNLDLSDNVLGHISEDGRDFVRKVLNYDPKGRLDVKAALNHKWLKRANLPEDGTKLDQAVSKLKDYQRRYSNWV